MPLGTPEYNGATLTSVISDQMDAFINRAASTPEITKTNAQLTKMQKDRETVRDKRIFKSLKYTLEYGMSYDYISLIRHTDCECVGILSIIDSHVIAEVFEDYIQLDENLKGSKIDTLFKKFSKQQNRKLQYHNSNQVAYQFEESEEYGNWKVDKPQEQTIEQADAHQG
jgi:hypothetical protein